MASIAADGGPVGRFVADSIESSLADPEFTAECERLRPYEELARIVIMRRAALGLEFGTAKKPARELIVL